MFKFVHVKMLIKHRNGKQYAYKTASNCAADTNKSGSLIYAPRDTCPANQRAISHPGNGVRLMSYIPLQVSVTILCAVLAEY